LKGVVFCWFLRERSEMGASSQSRHAIRRQLWCAHTRPHAASICTQHSMLLLLRFGTPIYFPAGSSGGVVRGVGRTPKPKPFFSEPHAHIIFFKKNLVRCFVFSFRLGTLTTNCCYAKAFFCLPFPFSLAVQLWHRPPRPRAPPSEPRRGGSRPAVSALGRRALLPRSAGGLSTTNAKVDTVFVSVPLIYMTLPPQSGRRLAA
jgi:hypothetical protein